MNRLAFLVLMLAAALGGSCMSPRAAPAPDTWLEHVQIAQGRLVGAREGDLLAFRGIPYAAPPVGALRWRPPQAPSSWAGARPAHAFGARCPQNADLGVFSRAGGEEDCLYLNVFASASVRARGGSAPVFVWIHGGGLVVGAGDDYDASQLALEGGAVVVTLNYRLGALGFLSHPGLNSEGDERANFGLMDQQFALEWVQRNIAAFGGDPENVVIAGESAGANSVVAHILSPRAAGMFQHAIVMSGGASAIRTPHFASSAPLALAAQRGADFAGALGCEPLDTVCLRAAPLAEILARQTPYAVHIPILDGAIVPLAAADALPAGAFNRVTLMNGATHDEGAFFAHRVESATGAPIDEARYGALVRAHFGDGLAERILQAYPVARYENAAGAYIAVITDGVFVCSAEAINVWMAAETPTYAYEFADRDAPSYLPPASFAYGAAHTFELAYLFPGFNGAAETPVSLNQQQQQLSAFMVQAWTQVHSARRREAQWPRYTLERKTMLALEAPSPRIIADHVEQSHNCAFWNSTGMY